VLGETLRERKVERGRPNEFSTLGPITSNFIGSFCGIEPCDCMYECFVSIWKMYFYSFNKITKFPWEKKKRVFLLNRLKKVAYYKVIKKGFIIKVFL